MLDIAEKTKENKNSVLMPQVAVILYPDILCYVISYWYIT